MSAEASRTGSAVQLPRRRSHVVVQLVGGEEQHRRGNVDAQQAPRRAAANRCSHLSCAAAGIEDVQTANIKPIWAQAARCSSESSGFGWVS